MHVTGGTCHFKLQCAMRIMRTTNKQAGQTTDYSLAQRELQELVCRNVQRVLVYELHGRVTAL